MTNTPSTIPTIYPGRLLAVLGFGLAILSFGAYVLQLWANRLWVPWYLPILSTVGAAFLVGSLWQARSLWRALGLIVVVLLAGAEWTFLLASRLPAYTGPVAIGKPFPAFATIRSDGSTFTQRDLQGDRNTVLVFFRGRW